MQTWWGVYDLRQKEEWYLCKPAGMGANNSNYDNSGGIHTITQTSSTQQRVLLRSAAEQRVLPIDDDFNTMMLQENIDNLVGSEINRYWFGFDSSFSSGQLSTAQLGIRTIPSGGQCMVYQSSSTYDNGLSCWTQLEEGKWYTFSIEAVCQNSDAFLWVHGPATPQGGPNFLWNRGIFYNNPIIKQAIQRGASISGNGIPSIAGTGTCCLFRKRPADGNWKTTQATFRCPQSGAYYAGMMLVNPHSVTTSPLWIRQAKMEELTARASPSKTIPVKESFTTECEDIAQHLLGTSATSYWFGLVAESDVPVYHVTNYTTYDTPESHPYPYTLRVADQRLQYTSRLSHTGVASRYRYIGGQSYRIRMQALFLYEVEDVSFLVNGPHTDTDTIWYSPEPTPTNRLYPIEDLAHLELTWVCPDNGVYTVGLVYHHPGEQEVSLHLESVEVVSGTEIRQEQMERLHTQRMVSQEIVETLNTSEPLPDYSATAAEELREITQADTAQTERAQDQQEQLEAIETTILETVDLLVSNEELTQHTVQDRVAGAHKMMIDDVRACVRSRQFQKGVR